MTKQEAKELSLEVWRYLAEHPEISSKANLPEPLFDKIKVMMNQCPLCELPPKEFCKGQKCPLNRCRGICPTRYRHGSRGRKHEEKNKFIRTGTGNESNNGELFGSCKI